MSNAKNIDTIGSVKLELHYDETISSEQQVLEDAERHFYKYMYPTIQEVLEHYPDINISIEKLVLDLGNIAIEDIPTKLKTLLTNAIEHSIYDKKINKFESHNTQRTKSQLIEEMFRFIRFEEIPWGEKPEHFSPKRWWNKNINYILSDEHHSHLLFEDCCNNTIIFYRLLQHSNTQSLQLILSAWNHVVTSSSSSPSTDSPQNIDFLNISGTTNNHGLQRNILINALTTLLSTKRVLSTSTFDELSNLINNNNDVARHPSKQIQDALLYAGIQQQNSNNSENSTDSLLNSQEIRHTHSKVNDTRRFDGFPDNSSHTQKPQQHTSPANEEKQNPIILDSELHNINDNGQSNGADSTYKKIDTFITYANETPQSLNAAQRVIDGIFEGDHTHQMDADLYFHTDNAGLILLHPFLINFFQRTALLDEHNHFFSFNKQIHAVHLLRHMSGKTGPHYSHLLCLEKILCGLPPNFPIDNKFTISKQEILETKDLFSAVSQYWKSVEKTSMEGIQHSFIQRIGIITAEDPYWLVRVEGSALDILMDNIPWEISSIILPWAHKSIWVEWQNGND